MRVIICFVICFLQFEWISCQGNGKSPSCPGMEAVKPCVCKKVDSRSWVTCESLSSPSELQTAIEGMQGYRISEFYIEKCNIGRMSPETFEGVEVNSLSIQFSYLTALGEINRPPFLGLERSLEELEIRESFVNEDFPLTTLSLSHLHRLSLLQIESNLLPVIGNDWFESGPYSLEKLYLLDVSCKQLGSHAFASLFDLKILILTGGTLSTLSREMFPNPAINLVSLDFSDNEISNLPDNIFSAMPSLKEVFLENNAFTVIEIVTWAPVWSQLAHVHLTGNPISCDENLKWMYKYRLPEVLVGKCSSPEKLRGKEMASLSVLDFD